MKHQGQIFNFVCVFAKFIRKQPRYKTNYKSIHGSTSNKEQRWAQVTIKTYSVKGNQSTEQVKSQKNFLLAIQKYLLG